MREERTKEGTLCMYVLCTVFCNVHLIKKGNLLFLFLHFAYPYFVQFCNLRVDVEHTFCFVFHIKYV